MLYLSLFEVWCYFGGGRAWGNSRGAALAARWTGAARAQGRVMAACFGSSSVCTEQYSVWAPPFSALWAPGTASATLPGRLLVTTIQLQPDRRQIHQIGKAQSCKRSQSLHLSPTFPQDFGSKLAGLALDHNLQVFSHNIVSGVHL